MTLTAFRIPSQPWFPTNYNLVTVLEEQRDIKTKNLIGRDGSFVLVLLEDPSYFLLSAIAEDSIGLITATKLEPKTEVTKG